MMLSKATITMPTPDLETISPLESHVGYWLRYVSNHVSHSFARKLEAEGVTVAEWAVLRELYRMGETAPHILAKNMGMTRGAISKLIERLVAKDYVDRANDLKDRRYQHIELTPVGQALVPYLAREADKNDAEFFGHLSEADKAALIDLLKEIAVRRTGRTIPSE